MAREIVGDSQGEIVLKQLGKPKKSTVVTRSTVVHDDDDVSGLNSSDGSSRPQSSRERLAESQGSHGPKTLLGNMGPDSSGKIDFSKNPDSVDFIVQHHEASQNSCDGEGFLKTGEKCFRQFNKMFSTKSKQASVTSQEIADALAIYFKEEAFQHKTVEKVSSDSSETHIKIERTPIKIEKEEYFPVSMKSVSIVTDKKVILKGNHFELCKILKCKNICMISRKDGRIEDNGLFHAACKNSDGETITDCPQNIELSDREKMAMDLFKHQFNGDELKAKKFLFLTQFVYKK